MDTHTLAYRGTHVPGLDASARLVPTSLERSSMVPTLDPSSSHLMRESGTVIRGFRSLVQCTTKTRLSQIACGGLVHPLSTGLGEGLH